MEPDKFAAEIETVEAFHAALPQLSGRVLQGLDLRQENFDASEVQLRGCIFLGCRFAAGVMPQLIERGALIFPRFSDLPYNPYRSELYTWHELMSGYSEVIDNSLDRRIYNHFKQPPAGTPPILMALAQRIHDHAMDNALSRWLEADHSPRRVVGVMGGHGVSRSDPVYQTVSEMAMTLAAADYTLATGGGPGVMEAANLGAWLKPYGAAALHEAVASLAPSPSYTSPGYVKSALKAVQRFPEGGESLAIPTWFYGHEPTNLFASHIAKYFANSIREDGLLAIALHGIIYAPGSAGTLQEIFQDACQNHYGTCGWYSPMVFFGKERFETRSGLFTFLQAEARGRVYADLLHLTDDPDDAVDFIRSHPPIPKAG